MKGMLAIYNFLAVPGAFKVRQAETADPPNVVLIAAGSRRAGGITTCFATPLHHPKRDDGPRKRVTAIRGADQRVNVCSEIRDRPCLGDGDRIEAENDKHVPHEVSCAVHRLNVNLSPPGQEGRRERLSLIASGGVVDKLIARSAPYCSVLDLTTPSAPARKAAFFFMAQPPLLSRSGNLLADTSSSGSADFRRYAASKLEKGSNACDVSSSGIICGSKGGPHANQTRHRVSSDLRRARHSSARAKQENNVGH